MEKKPLTSEIVPMLAPSTRTVAKPTGCAVSLLKTFPRTVPFPVICANKIAGKRTRTIE